MAMLLNSLDDIYVRRVQGWTRKNRYNTVYGVFVHRYDGLAREYLTRKGAEKRVAELRKMAKSFRTGKSFRQ